MRLRRRAVVLIINGQPITDNRLWAVARYVKLSQDLVGVMLARARLVRALIAKRIDLVNRTGLPIVFHDDAKGNQAKRKWSPDERTQKLLDALHSQVDKNDSFGTFVKDVVKAKRLTFCWTHKTQGSPNMAPTLWRLNYDYKQQTAQQKMTSAVEMVRSNPLYQKLVSIRGGSNQLKTICDQVFSFACRAQMIRDHLADAYFKCALSESRPQGVPLRAISVIAERGPGQIPDYAKRSPAGQRHLLALAACERMIKSGLATVSSQ